MRGLVPVAVEIDDLMAVLSELGVEFQLVIGGQRKTRLPPLLATDARTHNLTVMNLPTRR